MSTVDIRDTKISGVKLITPQRFGDARGFFSESWNRRAFADAGLDLEFVQDNHSLSAKERTMRGLHFQTPPYAQAKLVRCGRGRLLDVAVDIRKGSPTYGQWLAEELSFENGRQLFIPEGFAHGFVTLEPDTEIIYKCTNYYAPACDRSLQFDDPDIGIDWPTTRKNMVLSDKDAQAPSLTDLDTPFVWDGRS